METIKIEFSKDYNLFKTFNYNREVDEKRTLKISQSIKEFGFCVPILVVKTEDFYFIVDGQHRFIAGKIIEETIPYIVINSVPEDRIPYFISALNSPQKAWTGKNFFNMWLGLRKEGFLEIENFMQKYKFDLNQIMKLLFSGKDIFSRTSGVNTGSLRNPNFKITDFKKTEIIKTYEQLESISKIDSRYSQLYNNNKFKDALIETMKDNNYNHTRMLEVLKKNIPLVGKTIRAYRDFLIEIYNYGLKKSDTRLLA